MRGRCWTSCAVAAIALPLAAEWRAEWKNVGPGGGGWIQSILASRHADDALFVGCDVGGFYRSDDGGGHYAISNAGFEDYFVECLAEHPADPQTLFAGCKSGVYKSVDGGRHWRWLRKGFPPLQAHRYSAMISTIVPDPVRPETVYAAVGQPRDGKGGQGAIYRTLDGGETWRQIVRAGQLDSDLNITDLAVNPKAPSRLLIASPKGIFVSDDGGETWRSSSDGLPAHRRTRRLAQSPSDPRVVYVSLKGQAGEKPWQAGVYRSDDGGRTWQPRNEGLRQAAGAAGTSDMLCSWVDRLAVDPRDPDVAYAGGATWWDATVYKTTDGGRHWQRTFAFGEEGNARHAWIDMWGPSVTCLTLSPRRPDTLYFGTSGYVYRSDDGGRTWRQRYTQPRDDGLIAGTGLEVTCLHTVAPHPRVRGRVYFGFYDVGLLVSDDDGATFRRCMKGVPREYENSCMTVAFADDDSSHVWAGFGQWGSNRGSIAESVDNGASWRVLGGAAGGPPEARPRGLCAEFTRETGLHRLFYLAEGKGVFGSTDGGATWRARNVGLPAERVSCLARDGSDRAVFYAGVSCKGDEPGAVFRSEDRCETWRRVTLPDARLAEIRQIAARGECVVAATRASVVGKQYYSGGLFRSEEAGEHFAQTFTNRFCEAVAFDRHNLDRVYASLHDHPYHDCSTGGGVVVSADGGRTWRPLAGDGLTCKGVTCLAPDPHAPSRLWVGTGGNAAFVGEVGGP